MQGKVINGFEIKRLLGRGGMAEVWYAENEIGKPAAVKILNESLSDNPQIVERFHNEALVMVKLNHPNIRQVYGYGYIGNRHCIVMEYLEGSDLEAILKSGRCFTDEELRRWWNQTVDALNYTHAMDIVHRDIKPSNLFLDNLGNIKLLDYGIAKVRESISLTQTGAMMGTLMYMSPEQVDDAKHLGPKSDAYSLAVTFVSLLTGRMPYDSTSLSDFKIRESIVYKPLDLSGVPVAWQSFLAPYLEKNPEDRPALRHFDEMAATPSMTKQKDKPKSRKGLWIGLGIAAVAAVALLLLLKPKQEHNPTDSRVLMEQYLADSLKRVQDSMEQVQAQQLAQQQAEAEKKEEEAYKKCTTVAACDSYLKNYPKGRFVNEVQKKRSEFEAKAEANKNIAKNGSANGHGYVDLGLPSGALWATCNVGASKPEDYGNYYAWGETQTKSDYSRATYKYADDNGYQLTKYCNKSNCGNNGFIDDLTTLMGSDDPATAWGSGWCTPTEKQWKELLENTTNKWTIQNGVNGLLFTSMTNGKTLFLPAAGSPYGSHLYSASRFGNCGNYWSSSLYVGNPFLAWYLIFNSNQCEMEYYYGDRYDGLSVRAVYSPRQK